MEVEECGKEEKCNGNDAMPVISTDNILNATTFIELQIKQDDDENKT